MPPWVALAAGSATLAAAIGGALGAVRKAVTLAPAMRMVIRNMARRTLRALLTTAGMAAAMAIIISGMLWRDALDYMIEVQFEAAQPADAEIALVEPLSALARHEVARM